MVREDPAAGAVRAATRVAVRGEVHDVMAQELAGLSVQAGAAQRLVAADPERAGELLGMLRRSAAVALADARRLVALEEGEHSFAPFPSPASIAALVDEHRAAGHRATLAERIDRSPPPALGLTAYRLVQAALGALRTAAATSEVRVEVVTASGDLRILVDADVHAARLDRSLTVILQERARIFGGRVRMTVGDEPLSVRVELPMEPGR